MLLRFWVGQRLDFKLDWLLRLRLVVARFGEQDQARWWNSTGQLGGRGASVLARGFPRTHYFAQARTVFAAADSRTFEVFGLQEAYTLWRLDEELEGAFEQHWEFWLDQANQWSDFFAKLAAISATDLQSVLLDFGLVTAEECDAVSGLPMDASGRSIRVGFGGDSKKAISLLALGFSRGAPGNLVVPYTTATQ